MPQIVQVNEAAREVVLMQSVAGKQMGRAFHYDKVGLPSCPESGGSCFMQDARGLTPRQAELPPAASGALFMAGCWHQDPIRQKGHILHKAWPAGRGASGRGWLAVL